MRAWGRISHIAWREEAYRESQGRSSWFLPSWGLTGQRLRGSFNQTVARSQLILLWEPCACLSCRLPQFWDKNPADQLLHTTVSPSAFLTQNAYISVCLQLGHYSAEVTDWQAGHPSNSTNQVAATLFTCRAMEGEGGTWNGNSTASVLQVSLDPVASAIMCPDLQDTGKPASWLPSPPSQKTCSCFLSNLWFRYKVNVFGPGPGKTDLGDCQQDKDGAGRVGGLLCFLCGQEPIAEGSGASDFLTDSR